jgi:hypothetical protein
MADDAKNIEPPPGGRRRGHGGARANSGPKLKLTPQQRWRAGQDCEVAFRKAIDAELEREKERVLTDLSDLQSVNQKQITQVADLSISGRRRYRRSPEFRQIRADRKVELLAINGPQPDRRRYPSRLIELRVHKLPKGTKRQIRLNVAADWSAYLGKPISESTVRDCWNEYCKWVKTSDEEIDEEARNSAQT